MPEIGRHPELEVNRKMREELSCSEEEYKLCGFTPTADGKMRWNDKAVPEKEYDFAEGSIREMLLNEVIKQLSEMEKKGTLKLELDSLYVRLVLDQLKPEPDLKLVKDG